MMKIFNIGLWHYTKHLADRWSDTMSSFSWISQNRKHIETVKNDTRDIMIKIFLAKEKSAELQTSSP